MNKLQEFSHQFTKEEIPFINVKKNYFLNNPLLTETIKKIKIRPFSFSLPLGEIDDGKFKPSLALLEMLSKQNAGATVFLDEKMLHPYEKEILEICNMGFEVALQRTFSKNDLDTLLGRELRAELQASKGQLEGLLKKDIKAFYNPGYFNQTLWNVLNYL